MEAQSADLQTVRELVTVDAGSAGPGGDKATLIRDKAAENLDMSVVQFCEDVVRCDDILADTPSEGYVRRVLRDCNPQSVSDFDISEHRFSN
jgi:hypothetical protein